MTPRTATVFGREGCELCSRVAEALHADGITVRRVRLPDAPGRPRCMDEQLDRQGGALPLVELMTGELVRWVMPADVLAGRL